MNNLSNIASSNTLLINDKGYCWFAVNHKIVMRKLKSKPFSNFPLNSVRFKNKEYKVNTSAFELIDNINKMRL